MTLKIVEKVALSLAGLAALALSGCETTDAGPSQTVQWEGKDTAALTAQWGAPQDVTTLSDGSKIWVYRKTTEATVGDRAPTRTTTKERTESYVVNGVTMTRQVKYEDVSYEPGRISYCEAKFTIKDDVVTSAAFKGNGCTPEKL